MEVINENEVTKRIEREKRIEKESKKMKKKYKNIDKEKQKTIEELIQRASFLLILAQDMEQILIECDSFTVQTINASQNFVKTNPLLKDYRETIKSFQSIIKQIDELTKTEELTDSIKDELDNFLDD